MRRVTLKGLGYWALQQTLDGVQAAVGLVENRIKVSATDSAGEYLDAKLVPGQGLSRTILNPGGVEQYQLDAASAQHELIVDPSGEFDDTSIAAAVITAISGGATATDPWLVTVKPGTYVEPPIAVPPGIAIVSEANRIDTVFVVASSTSQDMFTCTGGYLAGLSLSGVTDPTKALIRCATASSLVVMHGLSIRNCSTGIHISDGAAVVITNFSVSLDGAGQAVTTGIRCEGATSEMNLLGGFFSAPAALLPAYAPDNPIQTAISVSEAEVVISSAVMRMFYNDASANGIFAENGAIVTTFSTAISHAANALHVGANGANTTFVLQGARMESNLLNAFVESSTAAILVSASTKEMKFDAVAGAKVSGLIQLTTDQKTLIAGDTAYRYPTAKQTNFGDFIYDASLTGYTIGGVVTDAGGLNVDITAGEGLATRNAPEHDTENVAWNADNGVAMTDNATNYVFFNPVTSAIDVTLGPPGADKVQLSVVETDSGNIIYIHDTRRLVQQPSALMHDYLLATRRIAWNSGIAVTAGTGGQNIDVSGGSWYRAWELLQVAGGSDVSWAYYFGSGGGLTRVGGVTAIDSVNYDNAGVLAAVPVNEFKADTLIVTSDNRFTVIYGTAKFASQVLAEDKANKAAIPGFLDPTGCFSALIVSGAGAAPPGSAAVVSYVDIRPDPNAATSGGGGGAPTGDHSALSNLLADDHTQYLRTDGSRPLTGSQDFGGNDLTTVGSVNGVTVENHSARHDAGGADELAIATPASNGFLSAADKTKLDAVISPSFAEIYASTPTSQAGLGAVPTKLTTFDTNGIATDSTPDHTNDRVTIGTTGQYKVSFSISFTGNNNQTYTFEVAVNGAVQVNGSCQRKMGVGGDVGANGFNCLLSLTAADLVTIEVSTTGTSLTAQRCTMNVVRI